MLKNCLKLCKAICNYGIKKNLIKVNPFQNCQVISLPKKIHGRLEKQESKLLLQKSMEIYPEITGIIAFGMYLGLRRGEILALKWSDIDFNKKIVSIQRQYTRYGISLELKTISSRRDLKLCQTLIEILKWHKKTQKVMSEFIFVNSNGGMVSLKTLHRHFKTLLKM